MDKRKTKNSWRVLIVVGVLCIPTIYFIQKIISKYTLMQEAKVVRYTAFGIDMPPNYSIHGIDVSSHQKYIHWQAVKEMEIKKIKIDFAFIKATEGLNDTDKYFAKNWKKLKENKIPRGAYLFFLATKSGKKQAENFIKSVQLSSGDLPPVVDIEQLYGVPAATMRLRVKECLQTLENTYKVKPIIYSYVDFYENYLGKDLNEYPLWIAHYFEKDKPRIAREWMFWQHSEKAKVNGITTNVDFNVFKGDTTDFKKILIK